METGLVEMVRRILWAVSFIAIGGAVTLMFFLVFAQSILGSKTIHSQLERLLRQTEDMSGQLREIAEALKRGDPPDQA